MSLKDPCWALKLSSICFLSYWSIHYSFMDGLKGKKEGREEAERKDGRERIENNFLNVMNKSLLLGLLILWKSVLPPCVHVYYVYAWCPQRSRALEHIELARDSFALSCGCYEPILVLLQHLQVFWINEGSLHHPTLIHYY